MIAAGADRNDTDQTEKSTVLPRTADVVPPNWGAVLLVPADGADAADADVVDADVVVAFAVPVPAVEPPVSVVDTPCD